MLAENIEGILQTLQPDAYGWWCELPPPIRFFAKPVGVKLDTRPVPEEYPPTPPEAAEIELLRFILSGLEKLLAVAERQYNEYNIDLPELLEKVHDPHVWISREWLEKDGPGRWTFVVGIADAPDWGIHLEFRELEFLEVWSGD
jgi:hypothetical protein